MKTLFLIIACGLAFVGFCYSLSEYEKKQFVVDCYKSKDICENYKSVHNGLCYECDILKVCYREGVF